MTCNFEEPPHPIFYCAEPFLKGDLKSKKGKQTKHFQVSYKDNQYSQYFGMQSVLYLRRSVVFGLISTLKNKEPRELDTPKRSSCFGRPNATQRKQQNHCSSVTSGRFLSKSWQRPAALHAVISFVSRSCSKLQLVQTFPKDA